MIPEVARKLLPLVNGKQNKERIEKYANYRIDYLYSQLETCSAPEDMYKLQGQLKEARRLLTLQDEANLAAKDDQ